MPVFVVTADSVNVCKTRLDRYCLNKVVTSPGPQIQIGHSMLLTDN